MSTLLPYDKAIFTCSKLLIYVGIGIATRLHTAGITGSNAVPITGNKPVKSITYGKSKDFFYVQK